MPYFPLVTAFIFLLFAAFVPVAQAAPLTFDGETVVKYETIRYHTEGIQDVAHTQRTLRLTFHQPVSSTTEAFLRFGHQSYTDSEEKETKKGLDQYGLLFKTDTLTAKLGSQDTYLGAFGVMFDNSSNVGEGMLTGIDLRYKQSRLEYHLAAGSLDASLFDDGKSRPLTGGELAYFAGSTRFMASYLHIPDLAKPASDFSGFSINAPQGKAEWITEYVHSSAASANQAFLFGLTYQPRLGQAVKIVCGEIQTNAVPEGKSSLGGYDNGIRGFQAGLFQALTLHDSIMLKYSQVHTIDLNIPISKTELQYTHSF